MVYRVERVPLRLSPDRSDRGLIPAFMTQSIKRLKPSKINSANGVFASSLQSSSVHCCVSGPGGLSLRLEIQVILHKSYMQRYCNIALIITALNKSHLPSLVSNWIVTSILTSSLIASVLAKTGSCAWPMRVIQTVSGWGVITHPSHAPTQHSLL